MFEDIIETQYSKIIAKKKEVAYAEFAELIQSIKRYYYDFVISDITLILSIDRSVDFEDLKSQVLQGAHEIHTILLTLWHRNGKPDNLDPLIEEMTQLESQLMSTLIIIENKISLLDQHKSIRRNSVLLVILIILAIFNVIK